MKITKTGKSMFAIKLKKKHRTWKDEPPYLWRDGIRTKTEDIIIKNAYKKILKNLHCGTCKSVYRKPKRCSYCNEKLETPYQVCKLCGKQQNRSRTILKQVQREVWRRDEGKCVECGSQVRLEYDHNIPFSKGGSNTVRNIQLLCERYNRKKYNNIGGK